MPDEEYAESEKRLDNAEHIRLQKLKFFSDCMDKAHDMVQALGFEVTDPNYILALQFANAELTGAGMYQRNWLRSGNPRVGTIADLSELVEKASAALGHADEQDTELAELREEVAELKRKNNELQQRLGSKY
jgi:ribosome assembly protein YihI (activator of Der GTPase)